MQLANTPCTVAEPPADNAKAPPPVGYSKPKPSTPPAKGDAVAKNAKEGGRKRDAARLSAFRHDAARAKNKGGKKAPRGTVSFMPKDAKAGGRDRSRGAARNRMAEKKAKRQVEV